MLGGFFIFKDQNLWPVVWTAQRSRPKPLFDFRKTRDQTRWAFVWTFLDSRPKPLVSCLICPRLKTNTVGQFFDLQSPKPMSICLNFTWLKTITVGQFFELPKIQYQKRWAVVSTTQDQRYLQLVELPKNLDQNPKALDRTSQDQNPKALDSCLNFQRF